MQALYEKEKDLNKQLLNTSTDDSSQDAYGDEEEDKNTDDEDDDDGLAFGDGDSPDVAPTDGHKKRKPLSKNVGKTEQIFRKKFESE